MRSRGHINYRGQDKDGRGIYQVSVWDAARGRRICQTVHGSECDAETLRMRMVLALQADTLADPGRLTVAQYLAQWLEAAALDIQQQSLDAYRNSAARWIDAIGRLRLDRLTPAHIQAAITAWSRELAPATVRRDLAVLRRALNRAVEWELLARSPVRGISLPVQSASVARALTAEEAIRLLAAAAEDPAGILVVLSLGLGVRIGEAQALRWEDVDWERRCVRVSRSLRRDGSYGAPKSGKARVVSLPRFIELALLERRPTPAVGMIGSQRDGRPMVLHSTTLMRRICRQAGIEPAIRFHDLRHSHATLLLADGEDVKAVSERLGHADIRITLQLYHHTHPDAAARVAERADRLLGRG